MPTQKTLSEVKDELDEAQLEEVSGGFTPVPSGVVSAVSQVVSALGEQVTSAAAAAAKSA